MTLISLLLITILTRTHEITRTPFEIILARQIALTALVQLVDASHLVGVAMKQVNLPCRVRLLVDFDALDFHFEFAVAALARVRRASSLRGQNSQIAFGVATARLGLNRSTLKIAALLATIQVDDLHAVAQLVALTHTRDILLEQLGHLVVVRSSHDLTTA